MKCYIYQIENLITHQSYIGQTVDITRRRTTHFRKLRNQTHDNLKLQASFNKYGEGEFHFRYWEFDVSEEELDRLECEYIEKYDSINNGFNLVPGGGKPPKHQKVKDEDIVKYLCVHHKYGDGYGKTFEEIFGWSKGTASTAKRRVRFLGAIETFDKMTEQAKNELAEQTFNEYNLSKKALVRQLTQGGCQKAYCLTQDDFNFAFAAQELGYGYTVVANYIGVKPATVKDWFNGRSRKKERQIYNSLSDELKSQSIGRVKIAELSGKPTSHSSK